MSKLKSQPVHEELVAQWHPTRNGDLKPEDFAANSSAVVWWRCEKDHEWEASIYNRNRNGLVSKCAVCMNRRVLTGFNDLATVRPNLAREWSDKNLPLTPDTVVFTSKHKAIWVCEKGHEWESMISSRVRRNHDCVICKNQRLLKGVNDLATVRPDLAEIWSEKNLPLTPSDILFNSARKVHWKWKCGHEWETRVQLRKDASCPICNGKTLLPGFNDLATVRPDIAAQWHPVLNNDLTPDQVPESSMKKVYWLGTCGHEWKSIIRNRTSGKGCPVCSNTLIIPGINDLATLNPTLAKEWHPTKNGKKKPTDYGAGTLLKVWWMCTKGHEWDAIIKHRNNGNGCPKCAAKECSSKAEREIGDLLESIGVPIIRNDRKALYPNELDIYIPSKNIAVEYNGIRYHSENFVKKDYHYNKYKRALDHGIQLIQIWEDDWNHRKNVVLRTLLHDLGEIDKLPLIQHDYNPLAVDTITADDTTVHKINYQEAKEFLDENHLSGGLTGTRYIALKDNNHINRAVMVIKNLGQGTWRIERYATLGEIEGGFEKILAHEETHIPTLKEWVAFSDNTRSTGNLYSSHGFTVDKEVAPGYMYVKRGKRINQSAYRLNRFKTDPNLDWVDGMTEKELAKMNKMPRIWDAGKIKWVKQVAKNS